MIKKIGGLALALVMSYAQADVLTFDDVPGQAQNTFGDMPAGYHGFNFSFTLDWLDTGPTSNTWPFGAHSGDFTLLNNNSGTGVVTAADGSDFTFDGLWAKQWATAPESGGPVGLSGNLIGLNNGQQVWAVATGLNGSFQFFSAQAGAIDELQLGFGNNFLVDDLALNGPGPVPVPGALGLFAAGVAVFGAASRRKSA